MGSKTQQALDDAAIAVLNHDLPRAAAVLDGDTDIDDLENQIDETVQICRHVVKNQLRHGIAEPFRQPVHLSGRQGYR